MGDVSKLLKDLGEAYIEFREEEDKRLWIGGKEGLFSMKSFYDALSHHKRENFPTKHIWNPNATSTVSFFMLCVAKRQSQWTTFLYIVGLLLSFGVPCLVCSRFIECFLS